MYKDHQLPEVRGRYRLKAKLSSMCWFGVGGVADVLFIPADEDDLIAFLKQIEPGVPIMVLGVGSNILIRDGGYRGVVIRLGAGFNYIENRGGLVVAGAATLDFNLAQYCLEHELTGLEFMSGIPGTVGGALYMNAGAYGGDIASVISEVSAVNMQGELQVFRSQSLAYTYRKNGLVGDWIFTEGRFKVMPGEYALISEKVEQIKQSRSATQPIKTKTGGSTFKNPPNQKAWQVIEAAGCRGLRIGDAEVSDLHCNFLINRGTATAADLENLITTVQQRVLERVGILLEPEIKIVGEMP